MGKNLIIVSFEFYNNLCSKLNRSQKFYLLGLFFFIPGLLSFKFNFFIPIMIIAQVLFLLGVSSDILLSYKKIWNTFLGKGLVLVLYAFSTNFAYALASQIINEIVKYESSSLVYTLNFVVVLLLPFYILIVTYVLFAIFVIIVQFYFLIILNIDVLKRDICLDGIFPKTVENYPKITLAARVIITTFIFIFTFSILQGNMPKYEKFLEEKTKSFLYNFEAYKYSRCKLNDNERVIQINENEIVVITKSKNVYQFLPKKCIPLLK